MYDVNTEVKIFCLEYSKSINVDGEVLRFDFKIPEELPQNINKINWLPSQNMYYMYDIDMRRTDWEPTEENFNTWVRPFIDLWQAEKDRVEQEQAEAEQELLKFENRKERALELVAEGYHNALEKGFVRTSLGFDADISPDSVATLSATNLALARNLLNEEEPKTVFRDFYGLKRELDKVQVELLICQINMAQNHIRELKYSFKTKIKDETSDNDSLNAALETCVYSTLDFSTVDESGKPAVMPFVQSYSLADRVDALCLG